MTPSKSNRREFLQTGAAGLAAAGLAAAAEPQEKGLKDQGTKKNDGGIPLRPLGRTGEMVSLICLGGHASTNPKKMSEKESLRLIQRRR